MLLDYKLIGSPKRFLDSRGGLAKSFAQRFRLLSDPPRKVRSVTLQTGDVGTARRRAVPFVENKVRQISCDADPIARTLAKGIQSVLDEYLEDLAAMGNSKKHVALVKYRIDRVISEARLVEYRQLDTVRVAKAISRLTTQEHLATVATKNKYREAMRAFSRWMYKCGRWPTNPLELLAKFKGDTSSTHRRAILTEQQFQSLLATTRSGPTRRNLTGEQRFWLYLLASQTGLRAQELDSLTPGSFFLEGDSPHVQVHCTISKRRQSDRIDLHPDLATALRRWLRGKPRTVKLWAGSRSWWYKAAQMLRHDLMNAGVTATVRTSDGPAVIDFHSFRCYRVTHAILTGRSTRVVLAAVRLSSEQLLDRYAKIPRSEISDCARAIPLPGIVADLAH